MSVKTREELKEWIEKRRNELLVKMAANADNPAIKAYYEGASDECMSVLIHMAVYKEG